MRQVLAAAGLAFTFVTKTGVGLSVLGGHGFVIRKARTACHFTICQRTFTLPDPANRVKVCQGLKARQQIPGTASTPVAFHRQTKQRSARQDDLRDVLSTADPADGGG